jgi:hypothetical protein
MRRVVEFERRPPAPSSLPSLHSVQSIAADPLEDEIEQDRRFERLPEEHAAADTGARTELLRFLSSDEDDGWRAWFRGYVLTELYVQDDASWRRRRPVAEILLRGLKSPSVDAVDSEEASQRATDKIVVVDDRDPRLAT